jgi:hypothetical protein
MINHLIVNGCSWTSGNELEQDIEFDNLLKLMNLTKQDPSDPLNWVIINDDKIPVASYDKFYDLLNWPFFLKENLGANKLTNLSIGGASNSRIVRTTVDKIMSLNSSQYQETMVVIGWTVSERDEICLDKTWQQWNATQSFETTADRSALVDNQLIKKINKIHEDYIVYLNSDYGFVKKYFQQVYLLSNLLENLGIKYFFFNALPAWWQAGNLAFKVDVNKEFSNQLAWHEDKINILGNSNNMHKFISDNNLPVATLMHPLSNGHRAWAKYLSMVMQERKII